MAVPRHSLWIALCALAWALTPCVPAAADLAQAGPGAAPEVPVGTEADSTPPVAAPPPADESADLAYDPLFDDEDEFAEAEAEVYDPLEPGNRAVYAFNRKVFQFFWDPLANGYRFIVPAPARRAVRRVFDNLNAPIYVANHVLQLEPLAAAETLGAFAMNVSFGVGGLFDTASGVGWELHETDFGQTLGVYGVGAGPYLMFPFLGPTTARDGFGFVIDRGFHPATYFFGIPIQLIGYGGVGFAHMEESIDDLNALEDSALDPYAVLRSAYMQDRQRSIEALRDKDAPSTPGSEPGASLASGERGL